VLCDPSFDNCRTRLLSLIQNEKVGIDVAFWFMQDARYSNALVQRFKAGLPVRVLVDTRANPTYAGNATIIAQLASAGIPIRNRTASGILHWKLMLFAGQDTVEFGSANYSPDAFVPVTDYTNYVAESVYYTDDPDIVNSFRTQFDNSWIDTSHFVNYANISGALVRHYPKFVMDPELNFPPSQDFGARAVSAYNNEHQKIDAIMYRITDRRHTDALIAAQGRGVPIRLIVENNQYRDPAYLWDAWNVDRLYMSGIKLRWRGHAGENHEKLTLLYGQALTIFGSSNWTSASATSQQEHNYFTKKTAIFQWFEDQFNRMWNNSRAAESTSFKPLPPDAPKSKGPTNGSKTGSTTVTLKWYSGPWAHNYDIYLGTSSAPPKIVSNRNLGPSATTSTYQSYTVALAPHTTYYWKIVSKTMANMTATGPIWSFATP
jgi:phosphatidylserine/phosphatidylglycerophosphate/cardiolipin synthase-like enzyme